MRKYIRNNILELFQTMYEAHREIKKYIEKHDGEKAVMTLADLRESAVQVGAVIEQSEGEGFITVKYLAEYCEALYEVAQGLGEAYSGNKAQKTLDRKLIAAETSVKNDIAVRTEVVFLPYKCAMFDSLWSIYTAAEADPLCDAYLIPIPYYDKNPDGSLGQFHYEGDEYPAELKITHYEAYDIAARKPDVIYIHNPYDNENFVTCVTPEFHSTELKKYCDKLVYVPYFVLGEPNPDNEQTLEKITHFVLTPGVINADEVIVQSEAMKQAYIKILLRHMGDTPAARKYLDNKIKGTGSPKLDKIADTIKGNIAVPEAWKKHLYKADGTMKKVILYNNSVTALLQNDEKMIQKMRSVFDTFYKNKDDICLLWRPHPLIKAAIESMRPRLWESYITIVEKYKADDWGIYDDTADLDRAIVLSDGYYGDSSSVIILCHKANKPVMLQNVDKL